MDTENTYDSLIKVKTMAESLSLLVDRVAEDVGGVHIDDYMVDLTVMEESVNALYEGNDYASVEDLEEESEETPPIDIDHIEKVFDKRMSVYQERMDKTDNMDAYMRHMADCIVFQTSAFKTLSKQIRKNQGILA